MFQLCEELLDRVEVGRVGRQEQRREVGRKGELLGDVPAGEELWRLLLVLALNKIRAKGAFHRAAKRDVRRTVASSEVDQIIPATGSHDEAAYARLQLVIDDALGQLPASYQAMVEFRIQGYEVAEIASKTGRSKRSVERILQEARRQLDTLLTRET